jgi:hypothetical protein
MDEVKRRIEEAFEKARNGETVVRPSPRPIDLEELYRQAIASLKH